MKRFIVRYVTSLAKGSAALTAMLLFALTMDILLEFFVRHPRFPGITQLSHYFSDLELSPTGCSILFGIVAFLALMDATSTRSTNSYTPRRDPPLSSFPEV